MRRLGAAEQFEGTFVERTFADLAVEAGDGFGVVIQNVGLDLKNGVERVPIAAKVGNQDFYFAAGNAFANLLDGASEDAGATVRLVVTIDAGDDRVAQAHPGGRFADAQRFFLVWRANGLAGRHRAEAAGTGANVAQNHKS